MKRSMLVCLTITLFSSFSVFGMDERKPLLSQKSYVSPISESAMQSLQNAAGDSQKIDKFTTLMKQYSFLNTDVKASLLFIAVEQGNVLGVAHLLSLGVSPNYQDETGNTPLTKALTMTRPPIPPSQNTGDIIKILFAATPSDKK